MSTLPFHLLPEPSDNNPTPDNTPPQIANDEVDESEKLLGLDVLIVEDEAMLALDLTFAIEDAGAQVVGPVHSLDSGLELVNSADFRVDAAVLDVDLAGKDVFPIAERLRALGVPFVFHTGHGDRQHLQSMFPGCTVCTKPTLSDELIGELHRLVARNQA